jgi:Fe-S cluster assembly iron-binding protein IscA
LGLALDEPKDDDETFDNADLTFLVAQDLMQTCGDIKLDYNDSGYSSGFAISSTNPISGGGGSSCGSCGSGGCG